MSNPYTYYGESGAEYFACRCETLYDKESYYCIAVSHPKKNKKILINEVEYLTAEDAQAALDEMASKRGWRKGI